MTSRLARALVAIVLLVGGGIAAAADDRAKQLSSSLGVVVAAPDFNMGAAFAFYNALWSIVGVDVSVYGSLTHDDGETSQDVGASLGINAELLVDGLYPSLGVTIAGGQTKRPTIQRQEKECPTYHGEPHCPVVRGQEIDHQDTAWGLEGKLTYVLFDGWLGLSAGYRMPFEEPLGGSFLLGVAVVMSPRSPMAAADYE